ncbi:uncharacterized protein LOC131938150 [Physella acuta]|nr:uncharacterized protein LOC131938150 [Physella acuta]
MEYHLQLELWRGNIAGAVQIARQRNELSDWIVAMAPLASHDLWELVSAEYAEQLEEDGQYHKAATYLLAAHKVHQAIDLFRRHRLFREAVSLAKMRLSPVDSLLEDLYTEWGQSLMKDGQFEQAAKCYLAMRHIQEAGKALTRRLDQSSLKTACHMTILANDTQQGLSYAFKLFSQNFVMGEWQEAYTFIQEHESLKFLLPLVSTHEMLVQQLAVMCPGLNLTHKPLTPDMFAHWDQKETANNKITLPEFLVDKSEIDPVVPWEPFLIDEHTFPHHLLRSWYKHFDINMVTQELTAMHAAISQLVSLRQNLGDLPSLLVMVSMDITLCLLVLLTSDTSKAIVHLIEAMSTLYNSKHKTLHQALCRLMLPQGPKYLLKLQQEFNASRVLITMESHGDVNKAGGEGHNSIKKFLSDIKDDSSISTPSVRCRELDCLRAYYYLAVLDFVRDGFPNGQQEEDIFDGMPNQVFTDPNSCVREFKNKELSSSVDPSCLTTPCVDTLIKNIHNSFGNISDLDQNGRISQAPVSDGRIGQAPVSGANLNSDKKTLCAGDLQSQPGHQKNLAQEYSAQSYSVDPPVVPFSQKKTQLPITAQQGRKSPLPTTPVKSPTDSIKSSKTSPTTSLHRQTSAQKGHLTNTNLLRLSKGILWDVQAKREALTETLGYIHRAISQHLLTVRPAEEHKSGCAMSPTPSSSSCKTSTDGRGLEEDGSCHQTRLSPSPLSPTTSEILNTGKTPVRPTFFNTNTSNNSESTSPKDNDSNEKSKSSGSNSGGERTRSLSPKSPNLNELSSRGPFRSKSDNSSLSPLSPSSALDPCVALQVEHDLLGHYDGNQVTFQKPTKVLWLDGRGSSVDQSPTSPKPAFNMSKLAPDGSTIPIEWYDLPIDVKYTQPYVTLALLKHEEDAVNQELKRVPEISHVPFPPTRNSIRRLLDACLNSPHLSKEEKHSYFKQLNDWAVLFAVTTHQQTETDTLFSSAALEHFTAG